MWELQRVGVTACGSCSVWELRCVGDVEVVEVAMGWSRGAWKWVAGLGNARFGTCRVWVLRGMGVVVCGGHSISGLHYGLVAVWEVVV